MPSCAQDSRYDIGNTANCFDMPTAAVQRSAQVVNASDTPKSVPFLPAISPWRTLHLCSFMAQSRPYRKQINQFWLSIVSLSTVKISIAPILRLQHLMIATCLFCIRSAWIMCTGEAKVFLGDVGNFYDTVHGSIQRGGDAYNFRDGR